VTGNLGIPGGGFGPRHGAGTHFTSIAADDRRPPGRYVPNQMSRIADALVDGTVRVLVLAGTDMTSSFADAGRVAEGLARLDLVVSFDLFMNDTARRYAHIVLPGTAWVEELGAKATNTHVYLMPKAVEPEGECRSSMWMLRELARRMDVPDFFPWSDDAGPLDAILDHPRAGHATVASLIAEGGQRALNISHVGHPDLKFPTPSGKVELYSERAVALGCRRCRRTSRSRPRGSAAVPSGPHAHALPRLLRSRTRAALSGRCRSGAAALDVAARCDRARDRRSRADPHVERAGRDAGARARHGADPCGHGVDARRVGRAERPDVQRAGVAGRRGRHLRLLGRPGNVRRVDRRRARDRERSARREAGRQRGTATEEGSRA
jgi:hypothetical protein